MTYIEKLHLEAIDKSEVNINPSDDDNIWVTDKNLSAKKSAEITKNIAIEFVMWIYYNEEWVSSKTNEELFQEYLKSKENEQKKEG